MLGTQDLVIGLVIALFFFGAKRLPEMARSLGKSMQEFKKGVSGDTGGEEPVTPATSTVDEGLELERARSAAPNDGVELSPSIPCGTEIVTPAASAMAHRET